MKKIFYLLALILLVVNINVFASEDEGVTLSLDCENLNLSRGGTATCDLNVSTISTISVDNVRLDIESDTDLTIIYTKGQFFDGNLNSGHLVLTASSLKTGNFKLGKITISVSDSATYEKKTITLKNISFTDSSNTTQIYKADNVLKEVNILSNNNNLKSISVDGKDIASFSSDTQKYDLEVEADKVNISAIAEEKDIAQIDGIGTEKIFLKLKLLVKKEILRLIL